MLSVVSFWLGKFAAGGNGGRDAAIHADFATYS